MDSDLPVLFLGGNKCDLEKERKVNFREARKARMVVPHCKCYTYEGECVCMRVTPLSSHFSAGRLPLPNMILPVLSYTLFNVHRTLCMSTTPAQCRETQCQHHRTLCMLHVHHTFGD